MYVPKNREELTARLHHAQSKYRNRDQLILLCNEMYEMKKGYKSSWLPTAATAWRNRVGNEYWQADAKPHNVIDVITSVLAGNTPQWRVTIPGNPMSTIPSRAERFLNGVLRLNSQRQQSDLFSEITFRTALDGGVGIRVFWDTEAGPPSELSITKSPDGQTKVPVATYTHRNFPIVIETVALSKLYPGGRGRMGKPFDEIFHVEQKTPNEAAEEWRGAEGASLSWLSDFSKDDKDFKTYQYVEWWGENKDGVWYACMFNDNIIIKPKKIDYPAIPYILTTFKKYDKDRPDIERMPFLFPMIHVTQKIEYLRSRNFRMADLYGNLPPIHRGDNPINLSGTWGEAIEMGAEDSIEFPKWPGNPPDILRLIEEANTQQAEASFSSAMFGQVSTRMSGYALSQLVGSDTLRTDTPKKNLELGLCNVGDLVFALLRKFSPTIYMSINMQVKEANISTILSGDETKLVTVECSIKPRHVADDTRLASMGAQLAAMPKPPVSMAYILENYFQIDQPEDEINRRLGEQVLDEPVVRLIAMHDVLKEAGHFAANIVQEQLSQAIQKTAQEQQPGATPQAPQAPPGLGGGMEQAIGGNPPVIPLGGNVVEEAPSLQTAIQGGPVEA